MAAGAGWALVMMSSPAPSDRKAEIPAPGGNPAPKSTTIRVRETWTGEGGRLLRDLMEQRDRREDFRDILPAADRAAAALAAMGALRDSPDDPVLLREGAARFAHWLEADPKASMAAWDTLGGPLGSMTGPFNALLARATAEAGIPTLLACLHRPEAGEGNHLPMNFGRNPVLLPVLAKALAASASAAKLEEVHRSLQPSEESILLTKAIQAWPANVPGVK